jgi:radical SAM superfamily enzyme YgiQ (UPF0313 family)
MSKILFINSVSEQSTMFQIPLGILNLATILKEKKHDVEIIDFNYLWAKKYCKKGTSLEENLLITYEYINSLMADIVDFYCMCDSYHFAIMLSKYIKENNPNIKIIFGGPQASLTAKMTMEAFPWIDLIGIGEGERTIESIVKALDNDGNFESIPGIAFRKENDVICNSEFPLVADLDELPNLDYSLININDYDTMLIEAGRGCPFSCTYCSTKTFWKRKYRLKSPHRLFNEISYLNKRYNKSSFEFIHDLFTLNKESVVSFCKLVISNKLNITWGCSARIDCLDEEMISIMSDAGCKSIFIGIETGSQRMQRKINKNLIIESIYPIIKLLNKYNYKITVSFIYGFEDEKEEDVKQTLNMIDNFMKSGCKIVLNKCTVFVGTELFNNVKNDLILEEQFSILTNVKDFSYCKNIIEDNPEIFPNFYTFKTDLREKLKYLDVFITYFYIFLYKGLRRTYYIFMNYYKDNIIAFYREFETLNPDFVNEQFDANNSNLIFNRLKIIEKFIEKCDFREYSGIIKNMFHFESSLIKLKYDNRLSEISCSLDYNICEVESSSFDIDDFKLGHMDVILYKNDDNKIKVRVV